MSWLGHLYQRRGVDRERIHAAFQKTDHRRSRKREILVDNLSISYRDSHGIDILHRSGWLLISRTQASKRAALILLAICWWLTVFHTLLAGLLLLKLLLIVLCLGSLGTIVR